MGEPRVPILSCSVAASGLKKTWWRFMRSWKLQKATSILIPGSAVCPRSRALPNRIANAKSFNCSAHFGLAATPFVLPPATPKDRVEILQEAFRKTYRDPEFFREYKKLTADEPTLLLPENHEKAIKEIPRDAEAIELFKKLVSAEPLPPR